VIEVTLGHDLLTTRHLHKIAPTSKVPGGTEVWMCRTTASTIMLKTIGDRGSPWVTPRSDLMGFP
jgi:hypothetical protein